MRRVLAVVAGALGLLVLPAAPAAAAFTHAAWTSPNGVTPPSGGSDDWTVTVEDRSTPQQVTLEGVFEHPNGVASVSLALERSEYPEEEPPCAPTGFGQTVPGAAEGPTRFSFDVLLPCNGSYLIRANATSRASGVGGGSEVKALRLALTMAAPPAPAGPVRAEATSGDAPRVGLTWEPVPPADRDPDFAGYDIERAIDDGEFEVLASLPDADSDAYIDKRPDPAGGLHRYRVVSLRRAGANASAGFVAAPERAPEAEVFLEPPADETTDTTADDGEGGGSATPSRSAPAVRRSTSGVRRSAGVTAPRTATTLDTGFGETLPFDPNAQALADPPPEPAGDTAVVAQVEGDGGESTTKQTLALIAGGGAMGMGALLLRRILRQAASPYEILQ